MSQANHHVGTSPVPHQDVETGDEVELPFHGTCPRCHHLHTGTTIRFPFSQSRHIRFNCERCQHVMFGLGHNSTQTTLASVLTTSGQNTVRSSSPNNLPPCSDHRDDTVLSGGALDDQRNQTTSRNEESSQGDEHGLRARDPPSIVVTQPHADGATVKSKPPPINVQDTYTRGNLVEGTDKRPRRRIDPKGKAKKLIGLIKRPFHRILGRPSDVFDRAEPSMRCLEDPMQPEVGKQSRNGSQRVTRSSSIRPDTQNSQTAEFSSQPRIETAQPDEPTDELVDVIRTKKERLYVKRSEATNRKKHVAARTCYCHENCHCYTGAGRLSNQSSHDLLHHSNIPQHPLGNLLAEVVPTPASSVASLRTHSPSRQIAFTGAHLNSNQLPTQPSVRGRGSRSLVGANEERQRSRISSSTGTSQATTAVESRSSEARAASRASRRAMSFPADPFHEFIQVAERSRPALVDYLRGLNDFGHPIASRRALDPVLDQHDAERAASDSSIAQSLPDGEDSSHASATSLSHLPDPSDEQVADDGSANNEEVPTIDSSNTTSGEGSNMRTPQPHNPEDVPLAPSQPGYDEVSRALQALSEEPPQATEVTDFAANR